MVFLFSSEKSEDRTHLIRRVYRYRDDRYRVTYLVPHAPKELVDDPDQIETSSEFKLHNNIVRAQSAIQALGFCNNWDFFFTGTLSPQKFPDRLALDDFRHLLSQLIRNLRRESVCSCHYLLVPELHKNEKGWHMHGLLRDFPASCFRPFTLSDRLPEYIKGKLASGLPVYDFPRYRDNFGFCDVEPLLNPDAATKYLTKYVIKGLSSTGLHIEKGKHLYFASRGLTRPQLVEAADQFAPSPVIDDLEFDGFSPCFDHDIKCQVDGQDYFLGYSVWYELPAAVASELSPASSLPVSLRSYSDFGGTEQ